MDWLGRLFGKQKRVADKGPVSVFLGNTLSGRKDLFVPRTPGLVLMYTCGPTVYDRAHIGNLRSYVFSDTLARTLSGAGFRLQRVINITDVGHLVGDREDTEDKMAVGAKREHTTPQAIAERYTKIFLEDLEDLNIPTEEILFPRATEYIKEQIALAKTLEEKGFAYRTKNGLAFETARFPGYGKLGNLNLGQQLSGARVEMDPEKKSPSDFWLWRTAKPGDLQIWDSPWGPGNPGWHIECSAMIRALLGQEIDIHTGGEDHIAVHHNNEIAQSEGATGRTFVRYWMHGAFLNVQGEKISKSLKNDIYLSDVAEKHHPLSLRYFFLQAHYRTPLSFSFDALSGAAHALERLWKLSREIAAESRKRGEPSDARERFLAAMRDDLSTPQALSILWDALRSEEYSPEEKWGLIEDADLHLGLSLREPPDSGTVIEENVPDEVQDMLEEREKARAAKDFAAADRLRGEIEKRGYRVEDGPSGPVLTKDPR